MLSWVIFMMKIPNYIVLTLRSTLQEPQTRKQSEKARTRSQKISALACWSFAHLPVCPHALLPIRDDWLKLNTSVKNWFHRLFFTSSLPATRSSASCLIYINNKDGIIFLKLIFTNYLFHFCVIFVWCKLFSNMSGLIGVVHHHQDDHIQGVKEEVVNHFEVWSFGNHLAHAGLDIWNIWM